MSPTAGAVAAVVLVAVLLGVALVLRSRKRRVIATPTQRATYQVLHVASLAAPPLRSGLTEATAGKAIRPLHQLLGGAAVGLVAPDRVLAWDGPGEHHAPAVLKALEGTGRVVALHADDLLCDLLECPVRGAVVVPLSTGEDMAGALVAIVDTDPVPGLVRAAVETADWVSAQLAFAELDVSRERLAEAQLRALRAQISPHFIYNALSAISALVRTDPDRARELIEEFAEFVRYSVRAHGEYTTLAEELRSIDRYLLIERARFGERLQVRLQVAPEVLPVVVPYLCLQPLVENAVQHGLAGKAGTGTVSIIASDAGSECLISVEDDGVGMDPDQLKRTDDNRSAHVGLTNVDDRLRSVFGPGCGLVVETAPGAGTKVSMRVPKFQPGVRVVSGWAS
ncbi:putative regulator of cell autolysis [Cryptosporangium arvum DSM 44712]|uniref:Putative regulator of cell autolysis n=1 Tax=Cryptosporangium arvum DSM 44712 TaxID=927661 RepID=A0A010ZK37_9ACTN|nr:putative regulator of cell autolysis [Cryptosporangium arvum DSM 44712]